MTELRRFGLLDALLFLAVVLGAGGTRAWYVAVCADNARSSGPLHVQDELPPEQWQLIRNLQENGSFVCRAPLADDEEVTAHTSPGYPWLFAQLSRAFQDTLTAQHLMRWVQCGLGALTAGLYFLFARRAFRSLAAATLAGILCALHPFWVVNTAEINDGVLATFLLAVSLFLGARGGQTGGAFTSLLYGLTLAGLALVRAALLPFAIVALLWYLARSRTVQRGWLCGFLALLGFINGLAPWMLRNVQTFGDVFPIVDSTYLHLWVGNNSTGFGGPETERDMRQALAPSLSRDGRSESSETELAELKKLAELPQKERYQQLGRLAVEEVRANPARALHRRRNAGVLFFVGRDVPWEATAPTPLVRSFTVALWSALLAMLLLGVIGWRWTYGWRFTAMPAALAVLWIPLPYLLGHAEALSGPRLPLDGVFLCYAAFVLTCLNPNVGLALLRGAPPEGHEREEIKPARLP